ncbi:MAG TPA: TonB-dependent receptor, partial [Bacteroidetes bacterium]|nr:TonB-dependent receptor [Bacteroidota bacterium]
DESQAPPGAPDVETKDFILEKGNAYGVDFSMKTDYKRLYLWFVYSLGYVHRSYENSQGEMITYTPGFDRRMNVNVVFSYTAGAKNQWEFGARYNFGTGFPFTQVQGFYEHLTMPGGVSNDYTTENGQLGVIYADLFGGRLPTYHRLDIDVKKNFYFSAHSKLVIDFSVINVMNRKNVFYVDLLTGEIVYQLPVMPSLGLTFYF